MNSNKTTENLIEALNLFDFTNPPKVIIKLLYDKETGKVNGVTFEETDKPFVEISRQQYEDGFHFKNLIVKNGKVEEVVKQRINYLNLCKGAKWFTSKYNMLIPGDDIGWDRRNVG